MTQIKGVEKARDAVVAKPAAENDNERMIRDLSGVRGVGVESATLLVREAFCREFANRRSLGAYAGLAGTPFASGGMQREQGIGKDGNHRLRRSSWSLPGSGCGTSRTARWRNGSAREWAGRKGAWRRS